ncbi:alpha/beta hydrolase [Rudaeicoccus suwonensis]|uniref:Acetyl esterase/lipase n=1 Tax=Rudaeicoccus suwonensis TaxID=657409 RepID=A0A561E330_9MICO|nr:alpha/beta hydrolase [Rudaeicoccus suwonensis]TWE10023.1 acetyl esterase/lipase [Rudaeicoccus suwonensis]
MVSDATSVPPPTHVRRYGDDPSQLYDVRLPTGAVRGVTVVVIHGGFWRPAVDRTHAAAQAQAFADNGFHVAVLEYRRVPGDWAGMSADVRTGLGAIRSDADLPEPVILIGHSAGGHLVTWLQHQPEARGIRGTVSLAGAVDLHLVRDLGLGAGAAPAMMGDADEHVWRAADPALLGPPPAPVLLVHGTADESVPVEVSESYQAAAGDGVPLEVLSGVTHMELVEPGTRGFEAALRAVNSLADQA